MIATVYILVRDTLNSCHSCGVDTRLLAAYPTSEGAAAAAERCQEQASKVHTVYAAALDTADAADDPVFDAALAMRGVEPDAAYEAQYGPAVYRVIAVMFRPT